MKPVTTMIATLKVERLLRGWTAKAESSTTRMMSHSTRRNSMMPTSCWFLPATSCL
jgi:hypothetical protein